MKRKSNLELLRSVIMIMLIMHHYADHGGFVFDNGEVTLNRIFLQFIHLFGKMGICVYVLISGYFLVEATFRWKKVVKLILEVQFYCLLCFGATVLLGTTEFTWTRLLMSIFPISTGMYWFVTTYIILYILSPYLNIMIHNLGQKRHLQLICFLLVIWSFIPTFSRLDICYSQLGWFITLYLSAAYIRLYPERKWISYFSRMKWFFVAFGLSFLSVLILDVFEYAIPSFEVDMEFFWGQSKITTYLSSLTLFMAFARLEVKQSRFINTLAGTTFGIYLLHDNTFISRELWTEWLDTDALIRSPKLIPHVFVATFCIFSACACVDLLRKNLVEKPLIKLLHLDEK